QGERHAGAGGLGQAGAGQRREPRVDDEAVGQLLARRVVVGDDDVDAARPERRDLGQVRDAAVDGDQQVGARGELVDAPRVYPVAVGEAVRDVGLHGRSQLAQAQHQERRAGDAVGAVVAVDQDALAAGDGGGQPGGGGFEAGVGAAYQRRVEVVGRVVA